MSAPQEVKIVQVGTPSGKWVEIILDDEQECITPLDAWGGGLPAEREHKGWINPSKVQGRLPIFKPAEDKPQGGFSRSPTSHNTGGVSHDQQKSFQVSYRKDLLAKYIETHPSDDFHQLEAAWDFFGDLIKGAWAE